MNGYCFFSVTAQIQWGMIEGGFLELPPDVPAVQTYWVT